MIIIKIIITIIIIIHVIIIIIFWRGGGVCFLHWKKWDILNSTLCQMNECIHQPISMIQLGVWQVLEKYVCKLYFVQITGYFPVPVKSQH